MIISSIDLMGGKVVQLRQGKERVLERDDFTILAEQFDRYGETAVIDLDAASGEGSNAEMVKRILRLGDCRGGGGIRTVEKAKEMISCGARKVIIGSKAFYGDVINHTFLNELSMNIGREKIIIAIDAFGGEIVTHGWRHKTGLRLFEVVGVLEKYCSEFLFTSVEKEGMMEGIDIEAVEELLRRTENKVTVAGGVSSSEELRELADLGADVQVGMALYTGKINLAEGFVDSLNWKKGLIPTMVQDERGNVLMMAYSNAESLLKTFESGNMWYYSRSRARLWMKGETSGNMQRLKRIRADCDRDTLLATVRQKKIACHMGSYSCFGDKRFSLYELYEVIKERIENPVPSSYTAQLTDSMLKEKLLEEIQETIEAKVKEDIIWEASDVIYFLTVLLAKNGVEIDDVVFELSRRRKK